MERGVHLERAARVGELHDDNMICFILVTGRLFFEKRVEAMLLAIIDGEDVAGDGGGAGDAEVGDLVAEGVEVADGGAGLGVSETESAGFAGIKGDTVRVLVGAQGGGMGDAVRADKGDGLGGGIVIKVKLDRLGLTLRHVGRDGEGSGCVRAGDGDGDCGHLDLGRDEGHGTPLRHRLAGRSAGRPTGGTQVDGLVEGLVAEGEGEARDLGGRPQGQRTHALQRGITELVVVRRGLGKEGRSGHRRHRPEKLPSAHGFLPYPGLGAPRATDWPENKKTHCIT